MSETIDNKSNEIFKLHQSRLQFQNKLELRLAKIRQINRQLRTRIWELEYLLASGNLASTKFNWHNSNLPPSLDLPWDKPKRTHSLRQKSEAKVGGVLGHKGIQSR